MIIQLFVQFALASTLLRLFPVDARDLEASVFSLTQPTRSSTYSVFTLPYAQPLSESVSQSPVKRDPRRLGIVTSAESAIVIDRRSGAILFEKNRDAPRSIGSITKLMTAFVFLDGQPDLSATAMLLSEDVRLGGVQHIQLGQEVQVRDLLYASLVSSDNSATAALVRLSGMAYGDFVAKMNETAASMGMTQTQFVDPTGLSAKNTSVVLDIARLVDQVAKKEIIRDATTHPIFTLQTASGSTYVLENTDDLLTSFINQDPYKIMTAKTGFLPEAGYCFGAMFSRANKDEIISVVLGSASDMGRFQDVKAMTAWVYDVYSWEGSGQI